jgi:hypothetical protein
MSIILAFVAGVFLGGTLGALAMALLIGAHDCDAVQG